MQLICTNGLEGETKVRTRFFFGQNKKRSLITNSLSKLSNHDITVGLFSALKYLENIGYKIKGKNHRDVYYEVTKYLNVLGGTYILDYFTSEELEQKIIKYMMSIKGAICTE